MVIIIAGMIGVGKTTLTGKVAKHLGTKAFYEPAGNNPVLPLYYKNPKQYGFLLQIYFLNQRFSMIKKALSDDNNVLDRSIYEDALFTKENHREGNISDIELNVYLKLLDNMMDELKLLPKKAPDLLVYASSDFETILKRIKKRGRPYEQFDHNPDLKNYYYLMWRNYQKWFQDYQISPKIKINLQKLNLLKPGNSQIVLNQIDQAIKKIQK
ncbi:deoxyadenosine kinase [Philodulcilactobacillus myokoensis]|uniref:Deoxyadenosine kinase n=1 Tax=Philodulcilactobacillus myokoensis TaxID=2929573 RepID=A0A9W6B239_9LACO|nr:deoxynucleoside kinase [Philodulcilactobacillus myokoensis]GLB46724.1 deoxyadenosine kinase [Philodulcilactobacillus myokoensis]